MSYICQNNTCAIAISKAAFPVPMNCPVCQQPLVELKEAPLLSKEDEKLIASLPYVIAYPLKETLLQNDYEKRLHRLGYTFINFLKYLGLISISEFFNSDFKNRKIVDLFLSQLSEPSFGKWNAFIRESYSVLQKEKIELVFPEFYDFYIQIEKKDKKFNLAEEIIEDFGEINYSKKNGLSAIGMLIHFRNKYLGHGTPINEHKAEEIWDLYYPIFQTILIKLIKIPESSLYKRENGIVWKLSSNVVREDNDLNQIIDEEKVWLADGKNRKLSMVPFFIIPSDFGVLKNETQLLVYESYTGNTIKFFSPENIIKETSGEILQRLNLLLRDKKKETPFTLETFTKTEFLNRITEENKLLLDKLITEKKIIPGVYWHREEMEIKLREWIGAKANIFFIAAEAGSGKTNLLAEIQRQYSERGYPGLLIRAGRMEKNSLKEQVAYLLNIDANEGLNKYTAIAGTQAEPIFILIDGLNEANNAEVIWQEIMEWSKNIEPGSIKFVVTSRANTKSDLERYKTEEADLNFLYGENKDHEKGLGAYAFWLTPLDMNEMKGAWENYVAKDKSRYKPLFSFDDIATFDRAIYNQINNPLVLRLFLEIYNGKNLPKKGGNHLHIWQDWFKTFSNEEQTFLKLLADEVWLKGENELLLDDLLNNETLKPYLTSDLVNSPYARMKNMGWVTRYVKDLNGCLGFTLEGTLLYLLGVKLQQQESTIDLSYIQNTLTTGTKLQQSAIESFLCEQALAGDLDLVTRLIDAGSEQLNLCIRPLLCYLKTYGVESMINKVLDEPTENDFHILIKLIDRLNYLQLFDLKKRLCIDINNFSIDKKKILDSELLINILYDVPYPLNENILLELENRILNNSSDINYEIKEELALYYSFNGYGEKAIKLYEDMYDFIALDNPYILNKVGVAYASIKNNKKALEFYLLAEEKAINKINLDKEVLAMIYFNIAGQQEDNNKRIEFIFKALKLEKSIFGVYHEDTARTMISIARTYFMMENYELAIIELDKAHEILLKIGADLEEIFEYYGYYYFNVKEYNIAFDYLVKSLEVEYCKHGENNKSLINKLTKIGEVLEYIDDYNKSIDFFKKAFKIIDDFNLKDDTCFYVLSYLGYLHFCKGDYFNCINYYNETICIWMSNRTEYTNKSIVGVYMNLYDAYYRVEDYEKSQQKTLELISLEYIELTEKDIIDCHENIGNSCFYLKNYNKAIDSYQRVLSLSSDDVKKNEIATLIGSCYEKLNDYTNAAEYYNKCLNISDINENKINLSLTYFRIGFCSENLGDYSSAIESYKKGNNLDNKDYFLNQIAKCYEFNLEKQNSMKFHILCAELRNSSEDGIGHDLTTESINNAIRLAFELGKENELPEWIRNYIRNEEGK